VPKTKLPHGASELCQLMASKLPETNNRQYVLEIGRIFRTPQYDPEVRRAAGKMYRRGLKRHARTTAR